MGGQVGRAFTVTNSSHNISGIRKKTIKREIVIGPNAIKFIAFTIFAVLAMVYLTQSTSGANRSIKVRDLTDKKSQLEMEKERLEIEQTRLKSLKEIDSNIEPEKKVLEPVSSVEHTKDTVSVAKNN